MASLAWYLKRMRVMDAREITHRCLQQLDLLSLHWHCHFGSGLTRTDARRPRYAFCTATERQLPLLSIKEDALRQEAPALLDGELSLAGYHWRWTDGPDIWHRAADTGRLWPNTFFGRIDYRESNPFGDVRKLWEPSRLQHLVDLALAAGITRDEDRQQAVQQVTRQLTSWVRNNPPLRGPHYISAMECALRMIAACHALDLVRSDVAEDAPWDALLSIVLSHAPLIERRLSLHSSTGNHTVAEAAGLVYAGLLFPEAKPARRWLKRGISILAAIANDQVLSDGGGAEQATCYHYFNVQLLHLVKSLADHLEYPLPPGISAAVERGGRFLATIGLSAGWVPPIGDGDSGYALSRYLQPPIRLAPQRAVSTFRNAGYTVAWICTAPDGVLVFDHGSLGMPPAYGHGHADALSLLMRIDDEDVFLDTGTYTYTGDRRWRSYFRGTRAHNTVTVDGKDQARQETCFMWSHPFRAWLIASDVDDPSGGRMLAEHDGYRDAGVRHLRGIAWHRDQWLIIQDRLIGDGCHRLDLHWHLGLEPRWSDDRTFELESPAGPLTIQCEGGRLTLVRGESGEPGPGWRSPGYGIREAIPTVNLRHDGRLPHVFTTLIRFPDCPSPTIEVDEALRWMSDQQSRTDHTPL